MAAALTEAGARVAIASRDAGRAAAVASELGPGALGLALDVRDESSVRAGVDQVYECLGGLDDIR
jgi:NAD(P)-dependent dehydrogenase (short-subunit alcohol dehydrogenase family)